MLQGQGAGGDRDGSPPPNIPPPHLRVPGAPQRPPRNAAHWAAVLQMMQNNPPPQLQGQPIVIGGNVAMPPAQPIEPAPQFNHPPQAPVANLLPQMEQAARLPTIHAPRTPVKKP